MAELLLRASPKPNDLSHPWSTPEIHICGGKTTTLAVNPDGHNCGDPAMLELSFDDYFLKKFVLGTSD
jgi:hypothetical protein